MQIAVLANDMQVEEILLKRTNDVVEVRFEKKFQALSRYKDYDAFFILDDKINVDELKVFYPTPVIINSVESTLKELSLTENICRINAWPSFLKREKWEVVTRDERIIENLFNQLNWEYLLVKDESGLVSARILSMIINEAYYALGDNVSTKNEIDIAMKLGTNYPYGPFEWCEKIGIKKVYSLLKKLCVNDNRYNVAPAMEKEYALNRS